MTRSNRQLTQFAVDQFKKFTSGKDVDLIARVQGNTATSVHLDRFNNKTTFQVFLFGTCIFEVDSTHIIARNGGFLDSQGRPSRTTRERLNGLLDAAGELGWIPEGVRVFTREDGSCALGKSDACKPLGAGAPEAVLISRPSDLVFL